MIVKFIEIGSRAMDARTVVGSYEEWGVILGTPHLFGLKESLKLCSDDICTTM